MTGRARASEGSQHSPTDDVRSRVHAIVPARWGEALLITFHVGLLLYIVLRHVTLG